MSNKEAKKTVQENGIEQGPEAQINIDEAEFIAAKLEEEFRKFASLVAQNSHAIMTRQDEINALKESVAGMTARIEFLNSEMDSIQVKLDVQKHVLQYLQTLTGGNREQHPQG